MNRDIVVFRLESLYLRNRNRKYATTLAHEDAGKPRRCNRLPRALERPRRLTGGERLPRALYYGIESLPSKRLEQKVESLELECRYCVTIVGGRENHGGVVIDTLQNFESCQRRNLDVEKHNVRPDAIDELDRRGSVARFAGVLHPFNLVDQLAECLARESFIFYDHRSKCHPAVAV